MMPLRALPPLVLLGWALFMAWSARSLKLGAPGHPGPGFFPFWMALALIGVALVILARELRAAPAPPPTWRWTRVAPAALALVAVAPALGLLGFVSASALFLLALFRAMGTGWRGAVLLAVALAVAAYVVFDVWLQIQLPRGPLGF